MKNIGSHNYVIQWIDYTDSDLTLTFYIKYTLYNNDYLTFD